MMRELVLRNLNQYLSYGTLTTPWLAGIGVGCQRQ
jgi:hypothetical protein